MSIYIQRINVLIVLLIRNFQHYLLIFEVQNDSIVNGFVVGIFLSEKKKQCKRMNKV